jgi:hypothetical protein
VALEFHYNAGLSTRQREWIEDAINRLQFPFNFYQYGGDIAIVFYPTEEPSCEGHKDYMCTRDNLELHGMDPNPNHLPDYDEGYWIIELRDNADELSTFNSHLPPGATIKDFFQESIAHEIAHVITFAWIGDTEGDREDLVAMFWKEGAQGQLEDWNPLDKPWADRIQEAVAEFWKDLYLPTRVFDNRTNWKMSRASYPDFMDIIRGMICHEIISDD